jgi:hypothetical protein
MNGVLIVSFSLRAYNQREADSHSNLIGVSDELVGFPILITLRILILLLPSLVEVHSVDLEQV